MRGTHHALCRAILAVTVLYPAVSSAANNTSTWTGAGGDFLWGDPANWSDGVPGSGTAAVIPDIPAATIDLGGQSRPVDSLFMVSSVTLANGTLVANQVATGHTDPGMVSDVAASLTTAGPALRLVAGPPYRYDLRVSGPIVGSGFDVFAAGALAGASAYTGRTVVAPGNPATFQDAGSALNSSSYEVGATLNLYNAVSASSDRLNDAAPVRLYSGQLRFIGTADQPVNERVGAVELMAGISQIDLGEGASLRAGSLTPHAGTILTLPRGGNGTVLLDTPPTSVGGVAGTSRGVVPFVLTHETLNPEYSLTTYDPATGLRALDPAAEFDQALPSTPALPAPNVRLPQAATTAGDVTVNSLIVDKLLTLQGAATLAVNSGAILLRDNAQIAGDGTIVSPSDLFVYTANNAGAIDVPIHARALTFDSSAALSAPNDISALYVAGDLTLSDPRALGSGPVRVGVGLRFQGGSCTVPNDISLGPRYRPLGTPPAPMIYTDYRITLASNQTVTLDGHLTGDSVGYFLNGSGTLRLDGEVTFASLNLLTSSHVTLEVNGTVSSDHPDPALRPAAINLAGRIRGDGTILGAVFAGDLSPGPDGLAGRLTVADLYSNNGSGLDVNLDLAGLSPGVDYDQLVVLHGFPQGENHYPTLAAGLTFAPPLGTEFLVVDFRGDPDFAPHFRGLAEGATFLASNGVPLRISYLAGDGNDVSLTVVPEPGMLSVVIGTAGVAIRRRRRR